MTPPPNPIADQIKNASMFSNYDCANAASLGFNGGECSSFLAEGKKFFYPSFALLMEGDGYFIGTLFPARAWLDVAGRAPKQKEPFHAMDTIRYGWNNRGAQCWTHE